MNLPSIKTLRELSPEHAPLIRKVLEATRSELEAMLESNPALKVSRAWYRACYHPMPLHVLRMSIVSDLTECHGVEYVQRGTGERSPRFDYVNTGDSYHVTLVRFDNGRYRVTSMGDIVKRGNYA